MVKKSIWSVGCALALGVGAFGCTAAPADGEQGEGEETQATDQSLVADCRLDAPTVNERRFFQRYQVVNGKWTLVQGTVLVSELFAAGQGCGTSQALRECIDWLRNPPINATTNAWRSLVGYATGPNQTRVPVYKCYGEQFGSVHLGAGIGVCQPDKPCPY